MGPAPDETEAFKQAVKQLHELTEEKAVDWKKASGLVLQLVSIVINSHTK